MNRQQKALYNFDMYQQNVNHIRRHKRNQAIKRGVYSVLLTLFLVLAYGLAEAETGFMVKGGVAVHDKGTDCPEYCYNNPLWNFGGGYTWKIPEAKALYLDVYLQHESSGPDIEEGYGHNLGRAELRWYPFK